MKTLLIGGNRFVGVEILWQLLRAGHDLTVLALDSPPPDTRPHIRWLQADRNDEGALRLLFANESFDYVVDNIAYLPHQVERLLAALDGRIGRYLLTSTTDVYPTQFPRSYKEDEVEIRRYDMEGMDAFARYNYGKRSCESLLKDSGVPWTVLRPCIVTGPRDNVCGLPAIRMMHWFEESARSNFWVSRVLDGGPILLCGEDEMVFKLAWVTDVARAATHLLTLSEAEGQVYNVTGDEIWTNERLVRALATAAGMNPEIVHVRNQVLEQAGLDFGPVYGTGACWTLPDNAKLKASGWQPTPCESWLPLLLEANGRPAMRTWYNTRVQEIALARHIQRRQQPCPSMPPSPGPGIHSLPFMGADLGFLPGRLENAASQNWPAKLMQQIHSD
jgi:nucleoside-diphosphate-sugar epimerase